MFDTDARLMIDREAALHFRTIAVRKTIMTEVTGPIVIALSAVTGVPGQRPKSFGGECDLLAVDEAGRLLAIEVKPSSTSSIRWAPAQATVYARLFERWINDLPGATAPPPGHPTAGEVVRGMSQQRADLRLSHPSRIVVPDRPEVLPVVAIGRDTNKTYLDGLRSIQQTLLDEGVGHPGLMLCEVNMAGRLDPKPL